MGFNGMVSTTGATVNPICDFCGAPEPKWAFPASRFKLAVGFSEGGWAACEECRQLVDAGDREGLVRRALATQCSNEKHLKTLKALEAHLRDVHERFFKHRLGDAVSIPEGFHPDSEPLEVMANLKQAHEQVLGNGPDDFELRIGSGPAPRPVQYASALASRFPGLWKSCEHVRSMRGRTHHWPGHCFLPRPLSAGVAMAAAGRTTPNTLDHRASYWITSLAAWRMTQGIYRFDPQVGEALERTPLDRDLPAEVLCKLPEWCVYIETPERRIQETPAPGFFCFLDEMSDGGEPAYRDLVFLSEVGDPEKPETMRLHEHPPLPLGSGSLEMAMRVVKERSVKLLSEYIAEAAGTTELQGVAEDVARMHADTETTSETELLKPLIAYILYLCTENAEIIDPTGKRQQPGNPLTTKVKGGTRQFPVDRVTRWDVAFRLGAALRRGGHEASDSKGGTHSSPRPHIRTAHWHHFWKGPRTGGPRMLTVKWLPPIPVNVDEEHPIVPTIRPVE